MKTYTLCWYNSNGVKEYGTSYVSPDTAMLCAQRKADAIGHYVIVETKTYRYASCAPKVFKARV